MKFNKKILWLSFFLIAAGTTTYVGFQNNQPRVFNVLDFGGKPDGKRVFDGGITATLSVVTSATAGFTAADVGKIILIPGAGPSHADLPTTITGFTNSTTVTVAATASFTVSADTLNYGTDNTAAFQAALNADSVNGGGKVYFPNGPTVTNGAGRVENGTYMFGGPIIHNYGGDCNCMIHIPIYPVGVPFTNRTHFLIEGETGIDPDSYSDRQGDSLTPHTGVVLLPITQGVNAAAAFIGTKPGTGGTSVNTAYIKFRNLQIFVDANTQLNGPSLGGINMYYMNSTSIEDVLVAQDHSVFNIPQPTNEVAAIIVNQTGTGEYFQERGLVEGFKYGWVTADHVDMSGSYALACSFAYVFPLSAYAGTAFHLTAHWCTHVIYSPQSVILGYVQPGLAYVDVYLLNFEDLVITSDPWSNNIDFINDSANTLTGKVGYYFLQAHNPDLARHGGLNVIAEQLGSYGNRVSFGGTNNNTQVDLPLGDQDYSSISVRIPMYVKLTGGAIIKSILGGNTTAQFNFDAAGAFGGTPNALSGREVSLFDSATSSYVWGAHMATGQLTIGPGLSHYGLQVDVPTAGGGQTLHLTSNGVAEFGGTNIAGNAYASGYGGFERTYSDIMMGDIGNIYLNSNVYYSNAPGYKFMTTGPIAQQYLYNGQIVYGMSASGSAGAAATITTVGIMQNNGNLTWGTGTDNSTALVQILKTSAQLALHYDASHDLIFTVGSGGIATLAPSGTQLNITGHLAPTTNVTYDLGTSSLAWRDIYFSHTISKSAMGTSTSTGTNVTSATASGSDEDFTLTLVTSGAVAGTLADLSFGRTWIGTPHCTISSANAATGSAVATTVGGYVGSNATSTSNWEMTGAITAAGTYVFNVSCGQ